jgi:hypothetical protein
MELTGVLIPRASGFEPAAECRPHWIKQEEERARSMRVVEIETAERAQLMVTGDPTTSRLRLGALATRH